MPQDMKKWCTDNKLICAVVIIIVIWLIWHFVIKKEGLQPYYLDQMAMQASDPSVVNFLGRERDPLGMSLRDYYVENDMNAHNRVAPYYNNDFAFANHTKYLSMPREYRPAQGYRPYPLAMLVGQSDNVTVVTPSTDGSSAPSGTVPSSATDPIVSAKTSERMNTKNASSRIRFFH
jgi:hypothetical protein